MRKTLIISIIALFSIYSFAADKPQKSKEKPRDNMGREIVRGPVGSGYYDNVHIISNSVGIQGESIVVLNSVIEAPICIQTEGLGITVSNNSLMCELCIEFTGGALINNTLTNNECSGTFTNRPDVFGP